MPSNDSLNASGLTPSESKALNERALQPHEERIIQSIKEMYSCLPKESTFSIYAQDAVFHDPIGIAKGLSSVRAQFLGLAKIFPRADIPKFRVLENPPTLPSNIILIDQDVAYFRDPKSTPTKTVNSLLTLKLNDSHQVSTHNEEWDHEKSSTSKDGFFGLLNEQRKKMTASLTDAVVGKDPKE